MHSCETNFVALKQVSMIKVVFLTLMRACCDGYVNAQVFFFSIMRKNVIDAFLRDKFCHFNDKVSVKCCMKSQTIQAMFLL